MKIFIDSANVDEIREVAELGICDGVTTNPSLVAKQGLDFKTILHEIVNVIAGPVSAEVVSNNFQDMFKEAEFLSKISNNIVIKLPITADGLKLCKILSSRGIKTNVTLCFNINQALLAAKAGATYVSVFFGRLNDSGVDALLVLSRIQELFKCYNFDSKILASSIRTAEQVSQVATVGADAITIPYKIFSELYQHQLTEKGIAQFNEDWKKSGLSIFEYLT